MVSFVSKFVAMATGVAREKCTTPSNSLGPKEGVK